MIWPVQALVVLVQAHVDLVQGLVALVHANPPPSSSGRVDNGCSGARIWLGWSCLVGVCERGKVETSLLLKGVNWIH